MKMEKQGHKPRNVGDLRKLRTALNWRSYNGKKLNSVNQISKEMNASLDPSERSTALPTPWLSSSVNPCWISGLKNLRVIDLCCMSCLLLFVMEAVENKYIDHWKSFSLCLGVTPKKEQTFVSGFLLGGKMNYTWPNLWFNFCSSEKEGKNQSAWSETGGLVLTVASIWTPEHIAHSPSYLIFHFC